MKALRKISKALPVIFAIVFILSISSTASAYSTSLNIPNTYIDSSYSYSTVPPAGQWFDLTMPTMPGGYDATKVDTFTITIYGHGFATGSNIDVWLDNDTTHSSSGSVHVDSFDPGTSGSFNKPEILPNLYLVTVPYSYFPTGATDVYIGFACHLYLDSITLDIEPKTGTSVPEPTTMLLLGLGLVGLAGVRRKFKE